MPGNAAPLALAAMALAVMAPTGVRAAAADSPEEIIITGSAIKRADAGTAVPATVLRVEDLKLWRGLSSVESLLSTLSANQSSWGTSMAVGGLGGGASFADLRGIGANKTLVLLNGRRVANQSFDSSAPDLNAIPLAALDRVEVLRDGASSLYGTDAIGGVINFITRTDYEGLTATAGYDSPQHPGGATKSANLGGGFGNLERDGFNVFGFVDYQRQNHIAGNQRPFNQRFVSGFSPSTAPANYYQFGAPTPALMYNPLAPDCGGGGGGSMIPNDDTSCAMSTTGFIDYLPKSERASAFIKGDLRLNDNNTLSAEYHLTRSEVKTLIAPVPYGLAAQNPTLPDGTPNPYYPRDNAELDPAFDGSDFLGGDWASEIGCTFGVDCTLADLGVTSGRGTNTPLQPGFVWIRWRDFPNGARGDDSIGVAQRALVALQGSVGAWDYDAGLSYNRTTTDMKLISGYGDGDAITDGILRGVINPFGEQSAAGSALLDSALLPGTLMTGRGTMTMVDARISNRALGDWFGAGREAAVAVGLEYRKEEFLNEANAAYAELVVASTGLDPATYSAGSRDSVINLMTNIRGYYYLIAFTYAQGA
jgi:iron complex outermembrane receptor protein